MRRKPVVTLVVTMVAVLMVLFAVERAARSTGQLGVRSAKVKDEQAPDFMLQSIDGETRYAAEGLQVVGVAMDDSSPNDIGIIHPEVFGKLFYPASRQTRASRSCRAHTRWPKNSTPPPFPENPKAECALPAGIPRQSRAFRLV